MADVTLPANRLDPKVRTLWRVSLALGLAPVALAGLWIGMLAGGRWPLLGLAGLALCGVVAWGAPAINYARWRYEIRARDLFVSRGVVMFMQAALPFDRIQFVKTQQGPLDRRLGLMQLVVTTAGGSEKIPGLTVDEAERLREELSRVAGTLSV